MAEKRLQMGAYLDDRVSPGLKDIKRSTKELQKTIDDGTKTIAAFGAATALGAGLAAKSWVDANVSFESAFAGVRKTVDATEEQFAALNKGIIDMSKEIPVSVEELSSLGEAAGQLGVKQEDILQFTKTVAELGVTTNLSSQEAATSFARILNIYQASASEVGRLGSSVVQLGNNFATTEREITDFATTIAASGKVVGLTQSDIVAIGAAFSSVGIEAQAGGTAVSKALMSMNNAVADGGAELKKFADVAGVTADEFAGMWKSEPAKAFDLFVQGIGNSGDKAAGVLEDLIAGDVRLQRAFLSAATSGDTLTRALEQASIAFDENTALQEEAAKRFATTESEMQKLGNQFNALKIELGGSLLPLVKQLGAQLGGLVAWFSSLSPEMKQVAAIGTVVTGALAGLAGVIAGFLVILPHIIAGFTALGAAIGFLSGPIGIIIAAVAALAVAWQTNFLGIQEHTQAFLDWIKPSITALVTFITAEFTAIWNAIISTINKIVEDWRAVWTVYEDEIRLGLEVVKTLWDSFAGLLVITWTTLWESIKAIFTGVWEVISGLIKTALAVLRGDWDTAWNEFEGIFIGVWEAMKAAVDEISAAISGSINNVITTVQNAINALNNMAGAANNALKQVPGVQAANNFGSAFNLNNYFATGGVVHEPTVAMIGEGSMSEAVVPLPDGRSIPVRMEGGGGGGNVSVNFGDIHINKEVDGDRFIAKVKNELTRAIQLQRAGAIS